MAKKIVAPASPTITLTSDELAALLNPAKSIEAKRDAARLVDVRAEVTAQLDAIAAIGLMMDGGDGLDASHARGIGRTLLLLVEKSAEAFDSLPDAA